jgi:hypothetical protein
MESVMIATPREYGGELVSHLQTIGAVERTADGGFAVDDGKSRVYVTRNTAAPEELEPERLEHIRSVIATPLFYSVDFSDIALCRRVLELIADDPTVVVDNDHGLMLSGADFVRLLRKRRDWDWRLD